MRSRLATSPKIPYLMIVGVVAFLATARAGEQPVSKYSSTGKHDQISFHREKDDPSDLRGLFRGFGGYEIEFLGGDERSWINVKFGKAIADLRDATMEMGAGVGFFPHKANDIVEWRGIEENGRFAPYAIIYRIAGLTENGKPSRTRLIVIKLDKERSRIIGHAEGLDEDAEAKGIADQLRARK